MAKSQKNVLFIVFDQLRADCVFGALANAVPLPNLRALAQEACVFSSYFSVVNPCGPARASLLTGQYAFNHRSVRNGTPLASWHATLPRELRKLGMEPLLYGYTDTSHDPETMHENDPALKTYEGLMPGFREVVEMRLEQSFAWKAHLKAKGYDLPKGFAPFFQGVAKNGEKLQINSPAFYAAEDSDTAFLTDELLKSLAVREDGSWFAHATFIRPHPPLCAPAPYNTLCAPADMPPPTRAASRSAEGAAHPYLAATVGASHLNNVIFGLGNRISVDSAEDAQALRAIYMGLAAEVDHHFGRIMRYLRESGQLDNTLLVVTADHGEMLGDHYLWGKQTVFEPAFHVPLFIRDPEQPASHGRKVAAFSEAIDIAPTILKWLGATPPAAMNGHSLLGHLSEAPPEAWRDYVYYELDFGEPDSPTVAQDRLGLPLAACNLAVIRESRFKYVHFNGGLPPLLYDLHTDPEELCNLAPDPAFAPELLRLASKMLDHRMRHAYSSHSGRKITESGVFGSA
ncbi:MAG: alkaline phosphatase family protein [Paracoccaceae bacterium]